MRYYYGFFRPISLDKTDDDDDDDYNYDRRVRDLRSDFSDFRKIQDKTLHFADLDDEDDHEEHHTGGLFGSTYFDLSRKVQGLPK